MELIKKRFKTVAFMELGLGVLAMVVPPAIGLSMGGHIQNVLPALGPTILGGFFAFSALKHYKATQERRFLPQANINSVIFYSLYQASGPRVIQEYIASSSAIEDKLAKLALVKLALYVDGGQSRSLALSMVLSKIEDTLYGQFPQHHGSLLELYEKDHGAQKWIVSNFANERIRQALTSFYTDFNDLAFVGKSVTNGIVTLCWRELLEMQGNKLSEHDHAVINKFSQKKMVENDYIPTFGAQSYKDFLKHLIYHDSQAGKPVKELLKKLSDFSKEEDPYLNAFNVSILDYMDKISEYDRLQENMAVSQMAARKSRKL